MGKSKRKLTRKRHQLKFKPETNDGGGNNSSNNMEKEGGSSGVGGGGSDGEGGNTPLIKNIFEIPRVVKQILVHLNKVDDLKTFRLMSKLCIDESLDKWRSTAVFVLRDPQAERALKHTLGVEDKVAYAREGGSPVTLYRLQDKPFKNYKLKPGHSYPPMLPVATQDMLYFWEKCGPSLEYLDLSDCFFKKGFYLEGLKSVLSSCPNMEELKLAPYKTKQFKDFLQNKEYMPEYLRDDDDDDDDFKLMHMCRRRNPTEEEDEDEERPILEELMKSIPVINTFDKLKSLSIDYSEFYRVRGEKKELFIACGNLALSFINLFPNLTTFSLNHIDYPYNISSAFADQASIEAKKTGTKPIQLEKFIQSRTHKNNRIHLNGLVDYLAISEPPKLKSLQLHGIQFNEEFWKDPSQLKTVLNGVKNYIEDLNLIFDCKRGGGRGGDDNDNDFKFEMRSNSSFDLFDLKFSKLTMLKLVFDYNEENEEYIAFDFGVFRATPNLKYFHFGTRGDYQAESVRMVLKAEDLVKRRSTSWHRDGEAERRFVEPWRRADYIPPKEEEQPILAEGNIVLEQMEEFHYEGRFSEDALQLLGKWFKNLRVLETILYNDTFRVPFQVWGGEQGKLKKLTVLILSEGQVGYSLICEQREANPEVEVRSLPVERNKWGAGWTNGEDEKKCSCGNSSSSEDDEDDGL